MKAASLIYRTAKGVGSIAGQNLDPLVDMAKQARTTGVAGNVKGVVEGVVLASWRSAPAYRFTVETGKLQPKA